MLAGQILEYTRVSKILICIKYLLSLYCILSEANQHPGQPIEEADSFVWNLGVMSMYD